MKRLPLRAAVLLPLVLAAVAPVSFASPAVQLPNPGAAPAGGLAVRQAYRTSDRQAVLDLSEALFVADLEFGELVVIAPDGKRFEVESVEPIESVEVGIGGEPVVLTRKLRLTLGAGAKLVEGVEYQLRIARLGDGRRSLVDETVPLEKELAAASIDEAFQDSSSSVIVRFDRPFTVDDLHFEGIRLLDAGGRELPVAPIELLEDPDGLMNELRLRLVDGFFIPGEAYTVFIERFGDRDAAVFEQSDEVAPLGAGLKIEISPHAPQTLIVDGVVGQPTEIQVSWTVEVRKTDGSGLREETESLAVGAKIHGRGRRQRIHVLLAEPLREGDKIAIRLRAADGSLIDTLRKTIEFPAPKDAKTAQLALSLGGTAGEGQKPNFKFDLTADYRQLVRLPGDWLFGPKVLAAVNTRDKDGTNKFSIAYHFHRTDLFGDGTSGLSGTMIRAGDGEELGAGIGRVLTDLGTRLEMEDGFETSNGLAEASFRVQKLSWYLGAGEVKWYFEPELGVQLGENLGVKETLREFEGYDVVRGRAKLLFGWEWKKAGQDFPSYSLLAKYEGWYRFDDELDTEDIPKAEQTDDSGTTRVVLADGWAGFATLELTAKLSQFFGVEAKWEHGERPALFQDEDKLSFSFVLLVGNSGG